MDRPEPHSREWYALQARERGGYFHPWNRTLDGPDPEDTYTALLKSLLTPEVRVLEAGCGHGPDAVRYAGQAASWSAYDRQPELLELARRNAPEADFTLWDGRGEVPEALSIPFDLIVSRRGPTGVILRLPTLAAPGARFLYVGPRLEVPEVPERLKRIGWAVLAEWRTRVRAWLPSEADAELRGEFMNEPAVPGHWRRAATGRGLAYFEERYTVLAAAQ